MLELNYSLTKEDYIDYNVYTLWSAPFNKKSRAKIYFKLLGFFLLFALVWLFSISFSWISITMFAVFSLFVVLRIPQIQKKAIINKVEKLFLKEENQALLGPKTVTFSDTGIHVKSELSESRQQWKSITRRTENEKLYFLYTSSIQALIIPKRIMRNSEQKAAFEKILNQNISLQAEFEAD